MKIRFCAALLLAALVLLSGCAAEAASPARPAPAVPAAEAPGLPPTAPTAQIPVSPANPSAAEPDLITKEEAVAIALADAGLDETQVVHRRAEFDYEKGLPVYEVEFYSDQREYDYDIHAESGEVLFRDSEPERSKSPDSTAPSAAEAVQSDRISKEKAISIALADAGFTEDQVTRLKAEFDYDDGIPEYEVEFHRDGFEYDYKIHGVTGELLSRDKDRDD